MSILQLSGDYSGNIRSVKVSYGIDSEATLSSGDSIQIPNGTKFKIWVNAKAHCEKMGLDQQWAWLITIKAPGLESLGNIHRSGTVVATKDWSDNVVFPSPSVSLSGYSMPDYDTIINIERIRLWVSPNVFAATPEYGEW